MCLCEKRKKGKLKSEIVRPSGTVQQNAKQFGKHIYYKSTKELR